MPPLLVYDDAKRIRNLGFELLSRTKRTEQEHDLYLVIGQACGLLATVSFDLGNHEAATEQARAAWIYGAHIGDRSLCTWARGMEALIAYWSDRPRDSVRLAREAQQYSPPGTALVRVLCIEARAWSHLGNGGATARAIGAAHDAWDRSDRRDELHDEIRGEFSFDAARQAFCNGSAYVQLGAAESALRETGRALELYRAMPADQRWPKVESEAHTDLGAAYLLKSEFEGAREALFPVFALPPEQRVQGLTQRLRRVHSLLLQSPYRRSREARQLGEQIDDFTANAPGRMLPSSQPPGLRPL
jgi:tetratricopeptide (TPR) repeat protein